MSLPSTTVRSKTAGTRHDTGTSLCRVCHSQPGPAQWTDIGRKGDRRKGRGPREAACSEREDVRRLARAVEDSDETDSERLAIRRAALRDGALTSSF